MIELDEELSWASAKCDICAAFGRACCKALPRRPGGALIATSYRR
jgi:hypothetical protein